MKNIPRFFRGCCLPKVEAEEAAEAEAAEDPPEDSCRAPGNSPKMKRGMLRLNFKTFKNPTGRREVFGEKHSQINFLKHCYDILAVHENWTFI